MTQRILIANRGEIAIRIARAAHDLGHITIAISPEDDVSSRHTSFCNEHVLLAGHGASAYLDIKTIISVAKHTNATAVHPGYGFLSESASFSKACLDAGLTFIGSTPAVLSALGDKAWARNIAKSVGAPLPRGTEGATSLEEALRFATSLDEGQPVMIKAVSGGGGRGTRPVRNTSELSEVYSVCQAEALASFGNDELYIEELIEHARHIEVQILRDQYGQLSHAYERECTLQRRRQKLIEIAPSPSVTEPLRQKLIDVSSRLAEAVDLCGLATFEFLVRSDRGDASFVFIEANPRLQVEHTVTEEITGLDLVKIQIQLAFGARLSDFGVEEKVANPPRGYAAQLRISAETINANGDFLPSTGALSAFEPPTGPGVRVDTSGHVGYQPNPAYDPLLAKLIIHSEVGDFSDLVRRAKGVLDEFQIEGCKTNQPFLAALLAQREVCENHIDTEYVDRNLIFLAEETLSRMKLEGQRDTGGRDLLGDDKTNEALPDGTVAAISHLSGVVVSLSVTPGETVLQGDTLLLVEVMKMQHEVRAEYHGLVSEIFPKVGQTVSEGQTVALLQVQDLSDAKKEATASIDPAFVRPDLAELLERRAALQDANRPEAVSKMRQRNRRTARENIADLIDKDSFREFGGLVFAAQRNRRGVEELRAYSPADGMIAGTGSVNGDLFPPDKSKCAIISYDYTVYAGTQGALNHKKKDRLFDIAYRSRLPLVLFGGGGGGRPGDTDVRLGLDISTFQTFAKLKERAPLISIVSGPCFAGNAALAGCADVLIATPDANIGMGGPAMVEGGGLGVFSPQEIGPIDVQSANGVVDIVAENEAHAVTLAKQALSYFQGLISEYEAADQRILRHIIPENRVRIYAIRDVIKGLADKESVLELKPNYGRSMITAFVRIGGRAMGLVANDPMVLSGAIDADAAEKAASFLYMCECHGLPVLSLCDTPGFMVGPDVEKAGQVKQSCRLFIQGAHLSVPFFAVVLRKAYGLGAQAMVGGSFHAPLFAVSWPTGEFGAMGFEGAVKLGFRKELEAIEDVKERERFFLAKVDELYEENKALTVAEFMEIDDLIDPAETRDWLIQGLAQAETHSKA